RVHRAQLRRTDNDALRFAFGLGYGFRLIGPFSAAQVDGADVLAKRSLSCRRRADAAAELRLRAKRRAALRPGGHALDHLGHLRRIVGGIGDALEGVTGDTAVKRFLALLRPREALQPFAIRKLSGAVLALAQP